MRKYKIGQKVVFKRVKYGYVSPKHILPKNGEIVTIMDYDSLPNAYYQLKEYPVDIFGKDQVAHEMDLHPLEDKREVVHHKLSMPVPQLPEIIEERPDVKEVEVA